MVTVTPGIGAPVGSVTVPEIVARFTCAAAGAAAARNTAETTSRQSETFGFIGPPMDTLARVPANGHRSAQRRGILHQKAASVNGRTGPGSGAQEELTGCTARGAACVRSCALALRRGSLAACFRSLCFSWRFHSHLRRHRRVPPVECSMT